MTRAFEYTDSFAPKSSVIEKVFYDKNRNEMFVKLHSGIVAGYSNVALSAFDDFAASESAGQFWNWYIKNHYGTLNGDVYFIPRSEPSGKHDFTNAGNKNFSVTVTVNGDLKFDLDAGDVVEATKRVYELIEKSVVDGTYFVKEVKVN